MGSLNKLVGNDLNDYEYYENLNVSCEKCANDKAYLWYDKNEKVYLISCDRCGVNERNEKAASTTTAKNKKQMFCCEGFKEFSNEELYIDKNPRVFEVRRKLFYHFENSHNPVVEQIKFCPFCGVKFDVVGVGLDN
jgi:hypothetical protein